MQLMWGEVERDVRKDGHLVLIVPLECACLERYLDNSGADVDKVAGTSLCHLRLLKLGPGFLRKLQEALDAAEGRERREQLGQRLPDHVERPWVMTSQRICA
jgi:hypothetical protein